MKIGIIGTGAVGGYYGALLVKSGRDVHFLLRSDFAHVRAHGLRVTSVDGDIFQGPVRAYGAADDMPVCDIVIVALKTSENPHLSAILPKITRPGGAVVLLQNGLGNEADVAAIAPQAAMIGGLCFLCSQKTGPGHVRHLGYGSIRFGRYHRPGDTAAANSPLGTVMDLFAGAGVPVQKVDDLEKARWEKLVWNMAFNGPAVILSATTGRMMKNPSARALVRDLMAEVVGGAGACGHVLMDAFVDTLMDATDRMPDYSPSMKIDFEARRVLEIDAIYRRPIIAAQNQGFDMRQCRVILRQLEYLELNNQ